ncbi:pyridoxamine 5'-phosphate oxidase family protein [Clostridium sp. YIM B02505]|uniref:Pyridoxamine 5'-phosphate oxidase family protein n=1 Tax=Clostridium yunnanense TaxID=2800325 RepID=A0ABS1EL82_9CLOT|nr:pyridoxamine 5'-phosphate oxidase family protein [Clostridium yunnanense]MBK1810124.1 pyridoxamine 5'-phosphate oxidase family protein [Clostridium yunnanense]
MFREMRRKDREVDKTEVIEILKNGEYGVLATLSENGYPVTVPLSYVYIDNYIYFHSATDGEKLDNIQRNSNVSFCVVSDTEVLPGEFSTRFKSVVAYGQASLVTGEIKEKVLYKIIEKYSKDFLEQGKLYIEKAKDRTKVVGIEIVKVTGKARR